MKKQIVIGILSLMVLSCYGCQDNQVVAVEPETTIKQPIIATKSTTKKTCTCGCQNKKKASVQETDLVEIMLNGERVNVLKDDTIEYRCDIDEISTFEVGSKIKVYWYSGNVKEQETVEIISNNAGSIVMQPIYE